MYQIDIYTNHTELDCFPPNSLQGMLCELWHNSETAIIIAP